MAAPVDYPPGTLGLALLRTEMADPVSLPSALDPTSCTSVSLGPTARWLWQDTRVVAFPAMLERLNDRLVECVDLNYPCNQSTLALSLPALPRVVEIWNEGSVHQRLIATLGEGVTQLIMYGMPAASRFSLVSHTPNTGPSQPDIEMMVDRNLRWIIEAKRNAIAGPTSKALYIAAGSRGPSGPGFLVKRHGRTDNVDLIGYTGGNEIVLGKIMKQVIKDLNDLQTFHCVISDAVSYTLCVRHPDLPILYIGPPIGNAGLLNLHTPWQDVTASVPVPELPTHRPLGLALALCVISANEPTLVGPAVAPVQQGVPQGVPQGQALSFDQTGPELLAMPPSRMRTRSMSTTSLAPRNVPGLGRDVLTIARAQYPSFPSARHSLAFDILLGSLYGPFEVPKTTEPELRIIEGMVAHPTRLISAHGLPPPPSSPSRQMWQVCPSDYPDALFTLQRCLGSGRLWDAFEVSIAGKSKRQRAITEPVPIGGYVLKICCFPSLSDQTTAEDAYTKHDARQAAAREDQFYRGPLQSLQGSVIPIWKGLFGGLSAITKYTVDESSEGLETWAVLMQNAGTSVDVSTLSKKDRASIVSAYRQLHRLGVVHNDVSPRHWLRGDDGQIRIIDFDVAEHFEPGEADEAFECEDRRVRRILGLDGA